MDYHDQSVAQKECNAFTYSSEALANMRNIDLIYYGVNSIIFYKIYKSGYYSMYVTEGRLRNRGS